MGTSRGMNQRRSPRSARVNEVLREVIADELERIDDERLGVTSVTSVDVDPDLRHAAVYLSSLSDEAAMAHLSYVDLKGRQWQQALWQIVLHVVNHGTHHRGAVSGFIRSMGHTPPVLDLIAFYRSAGTDAAAG